jgi:stage V sporulation protein B
MMMDFRNWIIKPGFVGLLMFLSGKYIYHFFEMFHLGYPLTVISTVFGYVLAALALMFAFGALDKDELVRLLGRRSKRRTLKTR